jgi:hypothetical protein
MLYCTSQTRAILMPPLPYDQLKINFITNVLLSNWHNKLPYIIPLTRSVNNQFHYQKFPVHFTLKTSLCHLSHTINYHPITWTILLSIYRTINILMSTLSNDQLPINSITNVMLTISHYKYPYATPPKRSVTKHFLPIFVVFLTIITSLCLPSHTIR